MLPVKTIQPDYRHETFDKWIRYITLTRFEVENKNTLNAAFDLIFKPLNIQA
jgi:hypothetical protein